MGRKLRNGKWSGLIGDVIEGVRMIIAIKHIVSSYFVKKILLY